MKLKNVLILAFLILTLIPAVIVLLLVYKSGFDLSRESYIRNLKESLSVQVDYIAQTMENNMIGDNRFVNRNYELFYKDTASPEEESSLFYAAFQSYLEASEDKITVCILLDNKNIPIYTIGEQMAIDQVYNQLPDAKDMTVQKIMEFDLGGSAHSLGIITPVWEGGTYAGCLISVYDKSYLFKIISSYYNITDTSTYICRHDGEIISSRGQADGEKNAFMEQALDEMSFASEGIIETKVGKVNISGYYKNIHNTPWYLAGFVDNHLIYSFTNQFVIVYILIIIAVILADIILAVYFSKRVVEPINSLIKLMDDYQENLRSCIVKEEKQGYFETRYLRAKFIELMKTILLVEHNFDGIYQLYQSSHTSDTNIDIDVRKQTILSNKAEFRELMDGRELEEGDCIVERFVKCFCEKDQIFLTQMLENMRDQHLAVTKEAEVYTPYLNQKWFHILVVPMYEEERLSRLYIQLRDISGFKRQEFESSEKVRRDSLTGLYNRVGFTECVEKALLEEKATPNGLLFIDMDYFKLVNDNFGHKEGDELLIRVAGILQETASQKDVVARFGGDEFVIFLKDITKESIEIRKQELNRLLVFPYHTKEVSFVVSASIGASVWGNASISTLGLLLQQADAAMYQAKREFKENKK